MKKKFIKHRVNTIQDLLGLDPEWGAEIDLRSDVSRSGLIHLSHDPWVLGDNFNDWIKEYQSLGIQGPLILNTKEDGLEAKVSEILAEHGITNYFFLDTALPTLIRWTMQRSINKFALRYSQYEAAEFAYLFKGKAEWLWVDCFDAQPVLTTQLLKGLAEDFKICLVSPELQNGTVGKLEQFANLYQISNAICTKSPQSWMSAFGKERS